MALHEIKVDLIKQHLRKLVPFQESVTPLFLMSATGNVCHV